MVTRTSPLSFELSDAPIILREMVVSLSSEKAVWEAEKRSLEIEKDRLQRHAEYL
ncbi:MAG: hypothetical protein H7836_15175 [Magnetococcus sp. YQC-3]